MSKIPAFRFYPSDFLGSPDVQAMELYEVGAYICLLSTSWLSDRYGYLPDDDEKLRRWSRMDRKQWAQSKDLLLSKFPLVEDGWRANPRLVAEAEKTEAYSASRSQNGKKGGRPKNHVVTEENHMQSTDKSIGESTEKLSVSVSVFNKNPCADDVAASDLGCPSETRNPKPQKSPDPRHVAFREAFCSYFRSRNGVDAPWGAKEAGRLSQFLKENPAWSIEEWGKALRHRDASEVAHGEPLSAWIGRATVFLPSPIDRFGKPLPVTSTAHSSGPVSALSKLPASRREDYVQ